MNHLKSILIIIGILALNNILLLNMLGYFSGEPVKDSVQSETPVTGSKGKKVTAKPESNPPTQLATKPAVNTESAPTKYFGTESDYQFMETFRRVAQSQEFIDAIDEYQVQAARRREEINSRLRGMTASELYDVAMNSNIRMEKQITISFLQDNKINRLSVNQLKGLYLDPTFKVHGKRMLIRALVKKNDPDGIEWAKQGLRDNSLGGYYVDEILKGIYKHDPEFIKEHIANVNFNSGQNARSIAGFAVQQPDLAEDFITRNFNELIASHEYAHLLNNEYAKKVELSADQQQMVIEAYRANDDKRNYAYLSLLGRVDDIALLRDFYQEINSQRDQISFIHSVLDHKTSEQHLALAKELGRDVDDVYLQSILSNH